MVVDTAVVLDNSEQLAIQCFSMILKYWLMVISTNKDGDFFRIIGQ